MVTHEPDIAAHCRRIVRMRDGVVWSDEAVAEPRRAAATAGVRLGASPA
jgi:putative ABC transport system ATP-binding protein